MSKTKNLGKIIFFDTLAAICFIGVILFGWIPGPGGVPLFLLGLSLLAVNHEWAERWLETAKHKGVTFKKWLFPNIQWVRYTYDFVTVALMILGGWLIYEYENYPLEAFSILLICFSLFVFLINRDRFDKITKPFRPKKSKNKA